MYIIYVETEINAMPTTLYTHIRISMHIYYIEVYICKGCQDLLQKM